jgi:hypothetical protein
MPEHDPEGGQIFRRDRGKCHKLQSAGRDDHARAITKTPTLPVTISDFSAADVPATIGDEPVDGRSLLPRFRAPTKETFIEA